MYKKEMPQITGRLSSISLVFPAYNEELNIEKSISEAIRVLTQYADKFEVIVVNDGSADKTAEIVNRLAETDGRVIPVHHEKNRGYGAAIGSGFKKSCYDFVFFTDSDLQFNLEEISELIKWINNYDIVVGYRAKRADPMHRKLNAWAWNQLVRALLGIKVRDIDCAFKLFRRKVFDTITLNSLGAMVNTELLAMSAQHGFTMKEVPVSHYPREKGQQTGASLRVIAKAFVELYKMRGRLKRHFAVQQTDKVTQGG